MKKFLVLILLATLIFSGCGTNNNISVVGNITSINLDCDEPYIIIQWQNTSDEAVMLSETGAIVKLSEGTSEKIGAVKQISTSGDNLTLNSNSTSEPIWYKIENSKEFDTGKYLFFFEFVGRERRVEIETFVACVTATAEPALEPINKPTRILSLVEYEVNENVTKIFKEIKRDSTDSKIQLQLFDIYGFTYKDYETKTELEKFAMGVLVRNESSDDIIITSAGLIKNGNYINAGTSLDFNYSNILEKKSKANINLLNIKTPLELGDYTVFIEYAKKSGEICKTELIFRYNGEAINDK